MELSSAIHHLSNKENYGVRSITLPDSPPEIDKAYEHIKRIFGDCPPVAELPDEQIEHWLEFAKKTHAENNWNSLNQTEYKKIASCLWYGENPLSNEESFLKSFLQACEMKIKRSLCRTLIWIYLYNYKPNNHAIDFLGKWLEKNILKWDWIWIERQKEYGLFGNQKCASLISSQVMLSKDTVKNAIEKCGISPSLQSSGMANEAFLDSVIKYRKIAQSSDTQAALFYLSRLIDWGIPSSKNFAFPLSKTQFIESLLLPWENNTPDDKIMITTQSTLIDCFQDPRIRAADWKGVNESAMRVIRRWLVKRALAQFLDVVDELALDHQWKYRRAFWMAYYNKNVISDAWVAFASEGASTVLQLAKKYEDESWKSFGRLSGGGDKSHAILILKIGNITIADFSHNGKCRIWDSSDDKAPKPYSKYYDRTDFTGSRADAEHIHSNSPSYLWQNRVASDIANMTGVKLLQREYIPK